MKPEDGEDVVEEEGGHRVLVFAQLKGFLDLVESDLLRPMGIPFLRLDGGYVKSLYLSLSLSLSHTHTHTHTV